MSPLLTVVVGLCSNQFSESERLRLPLPLMAGTFIVPLCREAKECMVVEVILVSTYSVLRQFTDCNWWYVLHSVNVYCNWR